MHAHRLTHLPSLTVLAALAVVLLAACGGSNKPSNSGSPGGSSRNASTASDAHRYPGCMRVHGVTNFPDPQVNANHLTLQITPSVIGSPAFKSAQKACAYLLPAGAGQTKGRSPAQGKARIEGLLAFAACVRKHGFPRFPDPTSQGQMTVGMIRQAGINLQQPAVRGAGDACVSVSHGQITKSDVAQAVASPSTSGPTS
jgi:hypothetical protein